MLKDLALSLAKGLDLQEIASDIVTKGVVPAKYRGALSKIVRVLASPALGPLAWKELSSSLISSGKDHIALLSIRSALTMAGDDPGDTPLEELRPQVVAFLEQVLANDAPPELVAVIKCPHCERHFSHHS